MNKVFKYFEYAYLAFAAFFLVSAIMTFSTDESRAYFLLFFAAVAVGMFFFKRNFRRKMEERNRK